MRALGLLLAVAAVRGLDAQEVAQGGDQAAPTYAPTQLIDWFAGVCGLDDGTIFRIEGADGTWYKKTGASAKSEGKLAQIRYGAYDLAKGKWCPATHDCKDPKDELVGRWEYLLIGGEAFATGVAITKGGYFGIAGMRMETKSSAPVFSTGKCFPETSAPGQALLASI